VSWPRAPRPRKAGHRLETLNTEVLELYNAGQYDRAVNVATKALHTAETTHGPEHPDVAVSLNNLALVYHAQASSTWPSRSISARAGSCQNLRPEPSRGRHQPE